MEIGAFRAARLEAEKAVSDMADGPLKVKAFEIALDRLLDQPSSSPGSARSGGRGRGNGALSDDPPAKGRESSPSSTTDRTLVLRDEGFFKTPRTLGEIRDELQVRGWVYALTSLSGPVQKLVQRRELRRTRGSDGKFRYVAP